MNISEKINEIESKIRSDAEVLTVLPLDAHKTYHKKLCEHIDIDGLYCEFGVYRGTSITTFSENINDNIIYGFDSFEGLPETWNDENPQNCYSLNGQIPDGPLDKLKQEDPGMYTTRMHTALTGWNSNIRLIKGLVEDTVPTFLEENEGPIAFAHMDLDLYSSTRSVFNNIAPRIVDGTVIAFDELLDYPEYREHEIKAFAQLLLENDLDFTPLIYHNNGYTYQQACVKIKSK
jgi:hypothetical protein